MDLSKSLAQTQCRISEVLRHVPGASGLYVFGSCATPYIDPYADIDMQLVSVDMALSFIQTELGREPINAALNWLWLA
jgi:predicted nucleotidyltransferase